MGTWGLKDVTSVTFKEGCPFKGQLNVRVKQGAAGLGQNKAN